MKYDFIIVGQGLAGTVLAWTLERAGKSVFVIDEAIDNSASPVSSAMINPVTGRRFVKSWLIDALIPKAREVYTAIGKEIGAELIEELDVLRVFKSAREQNDFNGRLGDGDYDQYIQAFHEEIPNLKMELGAGRITDSFRVRNQLFLSALRNKWKEKGQFEEKAFDFADLEILNEGLRYKTIDAQAIVFCEGFRMKANPFFKFVPLEANKGEVLIIKCPGLSRKHTLKKGITVMPWQEDLFWAGTTMNVNDSGNSFGESAEGDMRAMLDALLNLPYEVVDRLVGVRPTNGHNRRPFLGTHPKYAALHVFNGFGTKGSSLIPYFAEHLCAHLLERKDLLPEVNIEQYFPV